MELLILVPILLVMGAVAVVLALNEQPVPATAAFAPTPARTPQKMVAQLNPEPSKAPAAKIVVLPGGTPLREQDDEEYDESQEEIVPVTDTSFSHADVLLADALTEMIGLKAELYHLRTKIESLNTEVARLSGGPNRTPPAAAKQPIPLRRAA